MGRNSHDHERSAAGLDFDFPIRERAASLGQALAEDGPEAFFQELGNLIPAGVRDQIRNYPLLALTAGVALGVWLGMKKSQDIIAAGTSVVTAAAMSNVSAALGRAGRGEE